MTTSTPASSSQWHSITPSSRPLTLTIVELTPLALTLSLTLASLSQQPHPSSSSNSSTPLQHPHTPVQHVAHHSHSHSHHAQSAGKNRKKPRHRRDSDEELAAIEHDEFANDHFSLVPGSWPTTVASTNFKDLLSHGVVVSVNGQPWSRIVAHVSDPDEEEDDEADNTDDQWEDDWDHAGEEDGVNTAMEEISGVVTRRRRGRGGSNMGTREIERTIKSRRKKLDKDRAVVVVYGLNPGKEYEIELKVVGAVDGEGVVVNSSPSTLHPHSRSRANSLRSRSRPRSRSNSLNAASPLSHETPSQITPPATPIPTSVLNPVDTQAAQLRHLIAAAHIEKDHLTAQMKEARRASQRAEAAIKLEIETLKKATEKAGALDLRAKQKALALQEQVKQGWAGAETAESEMTSLEGGLSALEGRLEGYRTEVEGVRMEWRVVKDKEDEIRDHDKRSRAEEDRKLSEVVAKVDKLKARREKKESEKLDLERRLEELEKEKEEAERRNQRKSSWDGQRLSAHPSLNNLAGQAGYTAGPAYRPRGVSNYYPRYPSAGAPRQPPPNTGANQPPGPLPSPTHSQTFYPGHQSIPSTTSPAFRPLKPAAPSSSTRTISGVNVAAAPFHPSSAYSNNTSNGNQVYDTTLMPPQLQHRIYLPNVRPRPVPNFHPPPNVVAEQQAQQAQTSTPPLLSPPAFPPLPSQSSSTATSSSSSSSAALASTSAGTGATKQGGPSLASIVTRAVLAPGSGALASQGLTGTHQQSTRPSPPPSARSASNTQIPNTPLSGHSNLSHPQSPTPGQGGSHPTSPNPQYPSHSVSQSPQYPTSGRVTFAPPPSGGAEFPNISANGPWGSGSFNMGGGAGGDRGGGAQGMVRGHTPPVGWVLGGMGRESPVGFEGDGERPGSGGRRGSGI